MGFNSVVVILNDGLHDIEQNPLQFTQGVVNAIRSAGGNLRENQRVDIPVGSHGNAASLVHMAHADDHRAYLVGGNTARFIPGGHVFYTHYRKPEDVDKELLKSMADAAGFRLVKKTKKKTNFADGSVMPTPEQFRKSTEAEN